MPENRTEYFFWTIGRKNRKFKAWACGGYLPERCGEGKQRQLRRHNIDYRKNDLQIIQNCLMICIME